MALVDANDNFIYVDIGTQGSFNDAIILKKTNLYKKLIEGSLNIPEPKPVEEFGVKIPYFFVGDGGFALHPNLMKPYVGS